MAAARAAGGRLRMERILPSAADLRFDLGKANAAERRGCTAQAAVDHVVVEADGIEEMRAAIAVHDGDAHLRHDLREAQIEGLEHVLLALLRKWQRRGLQSEPRTHRACAHAEQHGGVMHFAAVAGFDGESDTRADAGIDERLMHRAGGQRHRHRQLLLDRPAYR